jgi:hypothetical protein
MNASTPPTPVRERIRQALNEQGLATARTIANLIRAGYSTTTAQLRELAVAGEVVRTDRDGEPATWSLASPIVPTESNDSTDGDPDGSPADGQGNIPEVVEAHSDAHVASDRPSGDEHTDAPGTPPGRPIQTITAETPRARRKKGDLQKEVAAVLDDHPDNAYRVTELSHLLDPASPGAVSNALDKLGREGTAQQVSSAPRSFQTLYTAGQPVVLGHIAADDTALQPGHTGTIVAVQQSAITVLWADGSTVTVDLGRGDRLLHVIDSTPASTQTRASRGPKRP